MSSLIHKNGDQLRALLKVMRMVSASQAPDVNRYVPWGMLAVVLMNAAKDVEVVLRAADAPQANKKRKWNESAVPTARCQTIICMDSHGEPFAVQFEEEKLFGNIAELTPGRLQPGTVILLQAPEVRGRWDQTNINVFTVRNHKESIADYATIDPEYNVFDVFAECAAGVWNSPEGCELGAAHLRGVEVQGVVYPPSIYEACGVSNCAGMTRLVNSVCVNHPLDHRATRHLLMFEFVGVLGGTEQTFRVRGTAATLGVFGAVLPESEYPDVGGIHDALSKGVFKEGVKVDVIGYYRTVFDSKALIVKGVKIFYVTSIMTSDRSFPPPLGSRATLDPPVTFHQGLGLADVAPTSSSSTDAPPAPPAVVPPSLPNGGTNCSLHAALQCQLATPPMAAKMGSWSRSANHLQRRLAVLHADVMRGQRLLPMALATVRGALANLVSADHRHDIHYLFRAINGTLYPSLTRLSMEPNRVCVECGSEAIANGNVFVLPMLHDDVSFSAGIAAFVTGDRCDHCAAPVDGGPRTVRLNTVLVVTRCGGPLVIDSEVIVAETTFRLCAVAVHDTNHYYAYVWFGDQLYHCDDANVQAIPNNILPPCKAAVVVYVRRTPTPTATPPGASPVVPANTLRTVLTPPSPPTTSPIGNAAPTPTPFPISSPNRRAQIPNATPPRVSPVVHANTLGSVPNPPPPLTSTPIDTAAHTPTPIPILSSDPTVPPTTTSPFLPAPATTPTCTPTLGDRGNILHEDVSHEAVGEGESNLEGTTDHARTTHGVANEPVEEEDSEDDDH